MAGEIAAALDLAVSKHEDYLQRLAQDRGWPEEVARSLTLERDGTSIRAAWPKEMDQVVQDLEYGTQERAPMSVLPAAVRDIKPDPKPVVDFIQRALR